MGINAKEGGISLLFTELDSPLGKLLLVSDGLALTGLYMNRHPLPLWQRRDDLEVFRAARNWLEAYFLGQAGDPGGIPMRTEGTLFQKRVWEILLQIPFGQVRTYGSIARQLAEELGKPRMSAQAVGQAVGKNPISILIPCHRCVGEGNRLTGYAGGLDNKLWLLCHEGWKGAKQ